MAISIASVFFPSLSPNANLHFSPKTFQEVNPSSNISLGFVSRRSRERPRGRRRRRRIQDVKSRVEDSFGLSESLELESEIFDFMERSKTPTRFPTKAELIAARRRDLVEAIAAKGGWLSFGWDSEEEEEEEKGEETSPSGRSIEEEAGIDGILGRLERERSLSFGIGSSMEKDFTGGMSSAVWIACEKPVDGIERSNVYSASYFGEDSHNQFGHVHSQKGTAGDVNGKNSAPDMWRTWSLQRAGNPISKFEAGEIVLDEGKRNSNINFVSDDSVDENMNKEAQTVKKVGDGGLHQSSDAKASGQNPLHMRIKHLESVLSSALQLLRSGTTGDISHKRQHSTLEELRRLSDAWEFKETEIMRARDELRSTRAKLAVLEGKMALQIIEAQKITVDKKKRLDAAKRTLGLLHSICIIWPNSASEVLLAGSFDGWTSQRRMERSNTGIFSLQLKLYPGSHEFKFVVDGVWRIDPLRPVVHNNGHENNLLIIS